MSLYSKIVDLLNAAVQTKDAAKVALASRHPDGTWTITLGIDTSVEGYVDPKATLAAIASQLTKVAETKKKESKKKRRTSSVG